MSIPAAWHPDPLGRHEHRYWDGSQWTEHVADAGQVGRDPLEQGGAPTGAGAAASDAGAVPSGRSTAAAQPQPSQQQPFPQATTPQAGQAQTAPGGGAAGASNGMATAALIFGVLALLVSWVPFIGLLGVVGGILALVLGALGRGRARQMATGAGLAIGGMVTGGLAVLVGIASTVLPVVFFSGFAGDLERVEECVDETGDEEACIEEHAPPWLRYLDDLDDVDGSDAPTD